MQSEEAHELSGDTNSGRPCTKEENAVRVEGLTGGSRRQLSSVDETAQDDSARPLDIIVENGVLVAVTFEISEGMVCGEVLQWSGE